MTELLNILLVDDEPDLLEVVSMQLRELPLNLSLAGNGQEALGLLTAGDTTFDAVISDFNMPIMNGLELLREIRNLGLTLPFVFFTGYGDREKTLEAFRLGACDFMDKPLDFNRMNSTVKWAGEKGRAIRQLNDLLTELGREYAIPEDKLERLRVAAAEDSFDSEITWEGAGFRSTVWVFSFGLGLS